MFAVTRPHLAGIVLLMCGIVGGIAINLLYINTAYMGAVFLWWLSALGALSPPSRPVRDTLDTTEGP